MSLRPFFTYFGGKWRAAPKYPPPIYDTIIEPFAGSAGYSLRYPDRKIILVEKSEAIAGIWRYLIGASEREILALPLLEPGQSVDSLDVCQEARWLIGMGCGRGTDGPRKTMSTWPAKPEDGSKEMCFWGAPIRARVARQLNAIRHWEIIEGDYTLARNRCATWFVDPPYVDQGKHYPHGSDEIHFRSLADWCRERDGQVLVCEQLPAGWLDFAAFGAFKSAGRTTGRQRSAEALWMNDWPGAALWLPAKESA